MTLFSETQFSVSDSNSIYDIGQYSLFRNDAPSVGNGRPFGGTAVYSRIEYYPGYPYCCNTNGVEITVIRLIVVPHVTYIAIYRSPQVSIRQLLTALSEVLAMRLTNFKIFMGDFNVNWFDHSEREPLYNFFIREHQYKQLMSSYTTDNKTCIDHIYTNLPETQVRVGILETYFTDHRAIYALLDNFS